ncbi:hypothetical protein EV385_2376 [Krasilnikovia cinnamomea]|uniref:Copper(I)-binding protein n=1 Tax=Krasilnikovia cinnamomea TaxID=349313 RepID=A0A4Q7ZJD2_9ACTN|nr:hypothetical protein [Krasilnikovia cinnamomea]RZU50601.1 hypothetical protein EV385_2376 [Krasilnikovia cinnamomea]
MRSLGTRRVARALGAVTVAAVALTGCSAGQVAETALKQPGTFGVNTQNSNGSVLIRGLAVTYNSPEGFKAGGNAPLELNLFNQTPQPVTVTVSSAPPMTPDPTAQVVYARSVGLFGGTPAAIASDQPATKPAVATPVPASAPAVASPAPGGSAAAVPAAAAQPARLTIPPLSFLSFQPGHVPQLQAVGLAAPLKPGNSVNLVFEFSNGAQPLAVPAPMSVPFSPASRAPAQPIEDVEGPAEHE